MIVNRRVDRLFILIFPIGIFVFLSVRPVMRLTADPPSQYLQPDPTWKAERRAVEEELARGYWKSGVEAVQWEYGYGATLPASPPDDFRIQGNGQQSQGLDRDPATRLRYWARFRQAWILPESWERAYGWDMGWIPKSIVAVHDWFMEYWQRLFWKG